MNENTRNAFASYGLKILKQSVLLVLYEQYVSEPSHRRFLTITEIGEQLDIRPLERDTKRPRGKYAHMNGLTHGILAHLLDDEQVEWLGERGHWQITEKKDLQCLKHVKTVVFLNK